MGWGFILELESIALADGWSVGCEGERGIKERPLLRWEESRLGGRGDQSRGFPGHVYFVIPPRQTVKWKYQVGSWMVESRIRALARDGDINVGLIMEF